MARIGDEAALVLEGRLEPGEHLVEGRRQPCDLISARRHRKPSGRRRRDRGSAAPHGLDRAHRCCGERVAGQRRQQEREGSRDEQLAQQAIERVFPRLERARHEHHLIRRCHSGSRARASRLRGAPSETDRRTRPPVDAWRTSAKGNRRPRPRGTECRTRPLESTTCASVVPPVTSRSRTSPLRTSSAASAAWEFKRRVDRLEQRVPDALVDEGAHARQHGRHHQREGERQPQPDGQPVHPLARSL